MAASAATQANPSRIDLLTRLFSERGMDEVDAEALSCQVVLQHPIAQKLGVENLAREIAARGLAEDSARELATLLLAIELMDRGATYDKVITHLEHNSLSPAEALAGAIDASRIHRESRGSEEDPLAFFTHVIAGITSMSLALIALAVLLELAR